MSTYWGYKCQTCNETSEHWLNHGEGTLEAILEAWPAILVPAYQFAQQNGWVEMSVLGADGSDMPPLEWLAAHLGHTIIIVDEYGRQLEDWRRGL